MNTNRHPRGDVLQAFADRALGDAESAQVAGHCKGCAACRLELERIREMQVLLARSTETMRPHPTWPAVAARLERERRPLGVSFAFGTVLACAAGLALAIVVGGGNRSLHEQVASPTLEFPADGGSGSLLDIFATAVPEES